MKILTFVVCLFVCGMTYAAGDVPEAKNGFLRPVEKGNKIGFKFGDPGWHKGENVYKCNPHYNDGGEFVYDTIFHPGIDINIDGTAGDGDKGWPVFPIAEGRVVAVGSRTAWNQVIIEHNYKGNAAQVWYSVYGHSEFGPRQCKSVANAKGYGFDPSFETRGRVSVGDIVLPHQQLACIWDHGTVHAHLHLEVRRATHHPNPKDLGYFCENTSLAGVKSQYEDPFDFIDSNGPYESVTGTDSFVWTPNNAMCQDASKWFNRSIEDGGRVVLNLIADRDLGFENAFNLCQSRGVPSECRVDGY